MQKLKGVLFVVLGGASYGVLATFVKLANNSGLSTSGLNFLQYFLGFVAILFMTKIRRAPKRDQPVKNGRRGKIILVLFGTSAGLTSYFYYLSIHYLPVSIAIILLMQAIWMGVVLELILNKTFSPLKIIGSVFVIVGTMFAVNVFEQTDTLNLTGLVYGILASVAYTASLYASNKIALNLPNMVRSKYLVLGGLLIVALIWNIELIERIDYTNVSLWKYSLFLALFGAVIPPIAFNKGFPITGIGLGSILTSIEIPVSILTAHLLLSEQVEMIQWFGVMVIILSVILINYKSLLNERNGQKKMSKQ